MTSPPPNPLSSEELKHLHEIREVLRTTATPGWMIILQKMKEDAEEAAEDVLGAAHATDVQLAGLSRRWQQREAVYRAVRQYIQSCESERDMLISSSEEMLNAEAGAVGGRQDPEDYA